MEKDLKESKTELHSLNKEHTRISKEWTDQKEQLRVLNENLRWETEVCIARDKENIALKGESNTLKDLLSESKELG